MPWHPLQLIGLLFIALLVFGPKKLIEMGTSFGKAFREFREATKDMHWSNLMSTEERAAPPSSPYSTAGKILHTQQATAPATPPSASVVEGSIEEREEGSVGQADR